jgi:hypothetical protein
LRKSGTSDSTSTNGRQPKPAKPIIGIHLAHKAHKVSASVTNSDRKLNDPDYSKEDAQRRRPRHFHRFTGLTPKEFDHLLAQCEPAYQEALRQQREGPPRQRAVGAGHPFALPVAERLLLGLMYLRMYVTQSLLACLFNLDESNICRELNGRLLPLLLEVLPTPLRDAPLRTGNNANNYQEDQPTIPESKKPGRRIRTLEELFCAYPELKEVLVDATEQEVPKPQEKGPRKVHYSGKKKEHTIKTQVLTTKTQVLHVFGGLPGSLHDTTLLRASGVMRQIPPPLKVVLDCGYEGVESEYPDVVDVVVQKPIRRQRGYRLSALGCAYNQMVSRLRIPVEHVLSRVKKFGVLAQVFRGKWEGHENLFCVVSGLVNYKATGQLSLI